MEKSDPFALLMRTKVSADSLKNPLIISYHKNEESPQKKQDYMLIQRCVKMFTGATLRILTCKGIVETEIQEFKGARFVNMGVGAGREVARTS